ncbi:MAG: peptide deformylase [Sulfurovum sp.]|nr:MAG: peptide deformylase [Sulfurovum sp.]
MIKELVVYPDDRILTPCSDVRVFDEKLFQVLENMQDTMKANDLNALSAIQIAIPYNIIVIKDDETQDYHEYINARVIKSEGTIETLESTSYYPNIEVTIPRYEKIKIVYEDRNGKVHYADIDEPELSSTLQRKMDYLFGGTFLAKVSKTQALQAIDALAKGGIVAQEEVCPLFSTKDYFVSFTDKLLFLMGLSLLAPLVGFAPFKTFGLIAFIGVIILMIAFFFYAQYEAKKYSQCSSCQIGNNIGVIVKRVSLAGILFMVSRFIG